MLFRSNRLIKQGLYRDYECIEDDIAGVKGQILVTESIKRQTLLKGRLFCSYNEYTENNQLNQVLKATMLVLLRYGKLDSRKKADLRKILMYFSNVQAVELHNIKWSSLKYHRNNQSYQLVINICYLLYIGLLQGTNQDGYKLTDWIQDEQMHRLE